MIALLGVTTTGVASTTPLAGDMAYLGVRILKTDGAGEVAWRVQPPAGCAACRLDLTPQAAGQNAREIYYHLWVPLHRETLAPLQVEVDPSRVRRVLVSVTDLTLAGRGYANREPRAIGLADVPFVRRRQTVSFALPAHPGGVNMPPDDLTDVTQFYTYIETPGVYIRVGHADERRRGGPYAAADWPRREAAAALNLEFAAREAIEQLGIVDSFPRLGVDKVMLMNFDTNYPTLGPGEAHADWPPHWHMHLFWRDVPKVRRVGHFYIGPDGLLTTDMASDLKAGGQAGRVEHWFRRGEADETRTPGGDLVYAQTITPEGWFRLNTERGSCLLKPASNGFDAGVIVACDDKPAVTMRADDEVEQGRIHLYRDGRAVRTYRYDTDTGALRDGAG